MMGVMASPVVEIPLDTMAPDEEFTRWMKSEQRRIFLLCYRMLRDRDEADAASQDTFIKAYRSMMKAGELDDRAKWVTRIAVNTCVDRLRSRTWRFWKRRPRPEDEGVILAFAPSNHPSPEDLLYAREIEGRIGEAISRLSPQQRAVFTLRHYEDRRLDEIAAILGLELGTVKAHMARAVAKMRTLLEDLYIRNQAAAPRASGGTL